MIFKIFAEIRLLFLPSWKLFYHKVFQKIIPKLKIKIENLTTNNNKEDGSFQFPIFFLKAWCQSDAFFEFKVLSSNINFVLWLKFDILNLICWHVVKKKRKQPSLFWFTTILEQLNRYSMYYTKLPRVKVLTLKCMRHVMYPSGKGTSVPGWEVGIVWYKYQIFTYKSGLA